MSRSQRLRRHRRSRVFTVLCTLLLCREVIAQVVSAPPTADTEPKPAERSQSAANIVLVGSVANDHELALLFDELLAREDVRVEIGTAEQFDPASLFSQGQPGVTRVFVVLRDPHSARLHFRGPNDERYLLRKVTLPNGLDAVGRELLAQVVESSVMALVHSTEGLSREEARDELARDATAADATGPTPPSPRALPPKTPAQTSAWEFHVGLEYAVAWSGSDLGVGHGPALVAGARYRKPVSIGIELGAVRYFTQSFSTADLDASVQRTDFQALFEAGRAFAPSHSGFLVLGPALELSRVRPTEGAPGVALAAPKNNLEPLLRAELRYELSAGSFAFGAAAFVDVALMKTNYELTTGADHQVLAQPARLRPGAQVGVAVR